MSDCLRPTGATAIEWIFPDFENKGGTCASVQYRETTYTFECAFGSPVMRYRYWQSSAEALKHDKKKYSKSPSRALITGDGQRVGTMWRYARPMESDDLYRLSAFFAVGLSFSIDAPTSAQIDELIPNLQIWDPADARGAVAGADARSGSVVWK